MVEPYQIKLSINNVLEYIWKSWTIQVHTSRVMRLSHVYNTPFGDYTYWYTFNIFFEYIKRVLLGWRSRFGLFSVSGSFICCKRFVFVAVGLRLRLFRGRRWDIGAPVKALGVYLFVVCSSSLLSLQKLLQQILLQMIVSVGNLYQDLQWYTKLQSIFKKLLLNHQWVWSKDGNQLRNCLRLIRISIKSWVMHFSYYSVKS